MWKRIALIAAGVLFSATALTAAQVTTTRTFYALQPQDLAALGRLGQRMDPGLVMTRVVFEVDGVTVRADKALVKGRDITFGGNVRMTLPPPK
jgi:hypothetical protein